MAILLIYNHLRDAFQKDSDRQQGCLREDLPPSALEGGACEAGGPGPHGGFLLLRITTSVRHNWRLLPDTIASERHVQREKPNNLQLEQQTKALIHNKLAYGAKARLPTFSHNLHLVVHYISLTLKNIHKITTCRLFESIQFCDVPFFVTHRIICGPSAIPDNRCLTEWISSVKPHLFTDKLSILSQPYSVIRIIVASRTASHRKKLNFMQTHRS